MDLSNAPWRKSTKSHDNGDACVELANATGVIGIRDTKNRAAGHVTVSRENARALIAAVKAL
ncbi:DUF397 domain-containing protein [Actinomadura parmotrematis]|uniref:DUF397 domain-containing protein n=1 Tax=Actinomadura parmotrematis TaxID=2864039 RepID=A0ABS7FP84_9ACTN|nr:DUF397 domain-containing protein [Actinomadura parmotrematis]MBW8482192.1 DUF397 domain-containing protein [Actinomadura parmotrematis]